MFAHIWWNIKTCSKVSEFQGINTNEYFNICIFALLNPASLHYCSGWCKQGHIRPPSPLPFLLPLTHKNTCFPVTQHSSSSSSVCNLRRRRRHIAIMTYKDELLPEAIFFATVVALARTQKSDLDIFLTYRRYFLFWEIGCFYFNSWHGLIKLQEPKTFFI